MARLEVLTVPAFEDNYLWLVHDGHQAVAVDPGDADAIDAALKDHGLSLAAILLTHHHADHIGGVAALCARHGPAIAVYGPWQEDIAGVTNAVGEGDRVELPSPPISFSVLEVPGHTAGHIAYFSETQGWLFCGDTLFAGGCGRLLGGTAEQLWASLSRLAKLPPSTQIYCAHEYTLANLKFALAAEPANASLQARATAAAALRAAGRPTVPSDIALELATNPFLRAGEPAIAAQLAGLGKIPPTAGAFDVFKTLREWKNVYR